MSSRRHSPQLRVGQTLRVHIAELRGESELGAPGMGMGMGTDADVTLGPILGAVSGTIRETTLNTALGRDPEERGVGVAGGEIDQYASQRAPYSESSVSVS